MGCKNSTESAPPRSVPSTSAVPAGEQRPPSVTTSTGVVANSKQVPGNDDCHPNAIQAETQSAGEAQPQPLERSSPAAEPVKEVETVSVSQQPNQVPPTAAVTSVTTNTAATTSGSTKSTPLVQSHEVTEDRPPVNATTVLPAVATTEQGCIATEMPSKIVDTAAASPPSLVEAVVIDEGIHAESVSEMPVAFSDFLLKHAESSNKFSKTAPSGTAAAAVADATGKRKVAFDAETMRKTAPKPSSHAAGSTASKTLTKKQTEMLKKQHVSAGRRGPVAPKWDKGSKSQMQTDVYLEMAAAFERMLTNAETINAHLDSR